MAKTVPEIPYKVPVTDDQGLLSIAWVGFFRQLFLRIGGNIAPSNLELASTASVTALQSSVTSLSSSVSTINASLTTLQTNITTLQVKVNDLNQGPVL